MEHLLLKAAITAATDEGTFTAVISTVAVDRDRDIVEPSAVVEALHKWTPTGKKIPLAWNHSTKNPEDIVGHIEPSSAQAIDGGRVSVDGWVDQSFERGQHTWRLVKSGTLGFSYGYLIIKADKRQGGGLHIKELDIFEVTATPIPANTETQVLAFKSAEELREEAKRIEREAEQDQIPDVPEQPEAPAPPEIDLAQELQEVKAQLAEVLAGFEDLKKKQAEVTDKEPRARSVDPLRAQAEAVALEQASGGESLRKPPRKVASKPPDLLPLKELRQRTRDEMLLALSGEPNE